MRFLCLFALVLLLLSCFPSKSGKGEPFSGAVNITIDANVDAASSGEVPPSGEGGELVGRLSAVMSRAELPASLVSSLQAAVTAGPAFIADLSVCLETDASLRELVDKRHSLVPGYVPPDLVILDDSRYLVSRAGLMLRAAAAASLADMTAAARADGVSLVVSSAYRSYGYQEEVYNRIVREMGREAADRESARPGHSQHQTGLVADFGSIDDSFALTVAGRWMAANASRFGWSLSYPDGYESVTGYRWESWHYRYVGRDLVGFIDNYFGGIQQYALRFLHEYVLETL